MKILKYKKGKENLYTIMSDKGDYELYDDLIIKYELLLKKEISEEEFAQIIHENTTLKAYYEALKLINIKLRTKKEVETILNRKGYSTDAIAYALNTISKEGYFNSKIYIEAYINDMLKLNLIGEAKILSDLQKKGFTNSEIIPILNNIDQSIYLNKITKYITKKAKSNRKSVIEFKRITLNELLNKGFDKNDIESCLNNTFLEENLDTVAKLISKLYNKYIKKYDIYTTKQKIKYYLYQKGYQDIDIEEYLNHN